MTFVNNNVFHIADSQDIKISAKHLLFINHFSSFR